MPRVSPDSATLAMHLTLRAASPELVSGGVVTTASDVYSLGVVLYELLVDVPPFAAEGNVAELVARICEGRFPPPSSRTAPGAQQPDPELDALVLTAMAREPSERYASCIELMRDTRHYLAGEPLEAHPPSALYRLRKFARRHRTGLAAGLLFVVTLLGFAIGATQLSIQARAGQAAALAARERERAAREVAEEINGFLFETLEKADPLRLDGGTLTLLDLLDQATQRLEAGLDSTSAEAELRLTVGKAFLNQHLVRRAEPLLHSALTRFEELEGRDAARAETLLLLGELDSWRARLDHAETRFRSALEAARLADDPGLVCRAAMNLAATLPAKDEAERRLEEALEATERLPGGGSVQRARALAQFARLRTLQGRNDEARELADHAYALRLDFAAEPGVEAAAALEALAEFQQGIGNAPRAVELYREALALRESLPESSATSTLETRIGLAFALWSVQASGELEEGEGNGDAETLLRETLDLAEASLPAWHRTLAQARGRYGDLLYRQGRYAEAEPHLVASYEAWFEIAGENIVSAQLRARIASLYDQLGRTDEARIYRTTSTRRDDP